MLSQDFNLLCGAVLSTILIHLGFLSFSLISNVTFFHFQVNHNNQSSVPFTFPKPFKLTKPQIHATAQGDG